MIACGLVGATGCARDRSVASPPDEPAPAAAPETKSDRAQARELYAAAEERFAAGGAAQAAELVAHALEILPPTLDNEKTRHDLTMRLTHMQLVAFTSEAEMNHLLDARTRLFTRAARLDVVASHLPKETVDAMRRDVFTQLYEVEQRLEPLVEDLTPPEIDLATVETLPTDDKADRVRVVHVKTSQQPSVDDPEVRAKLKSAFSDPEAGLVLTRSGIAVLHGPRALVRVSRVAAKRGSVRGLAVPAREWIKGEREVLRTCYEDAFAREPIPALAVTIAVEQTGGQVTQARIERGGLVDEAGDRCLTEALAKTTVSIEGSSAFEVELTFFYESAVLIDEATGDTFPAWAVHDPWKRSP